MKKLKYGAEVEYSDILIAVNRGQNIESLFESICLVRGNPRGKDTISVSALAEYEPDTFDGPPRIHFSPHVREVKVSHFDLIVTNAELQNLMQLDDRWCTMIENFRGLYPYINTNGMIDTTVKHMMQIKQELINPLV